MASIKVRRIKEEEIPAVAMLESACFSSPWPEEQVEYQVKENSCATLLVALIEEEVVGYLDFLITFSSATIDRICVANEVRRKGIASKLLEKMFEILEKQKEPVEFVTLEVRASNIEAIKLYEKYGFEKITTKKAYYDDGEDALYMVRSLL